MPPTTYNKLGARCVILLDSRLIQTMQALRNHFKRPITINTWKSGGKLRYRGFRPSNHKSAKYSQHKYGRACDFDVKGLRAHEVRNEIEVFYWKFPHIRRMEKKKSWVHIDLCYTGQKEIVCFNP